MFHTEILYFWGWETIFCFIPSGPLSVSVSRRPHCCILHGHAAGVELLRLSWWLRRGAWVLRGSCSFPTVAEEWVWESEGASKTTLFRHKLRLRRVTDMNWKFIGCMTEIAKMWREKRTGGQDSARWLVMWPWTSLLPHLHSISWIQNLPSGYKLHRFNAW